MPESRCFFCGCKLKNNGYFSYLAYRTADARPKQSYLAVCPECCDDILADVREAIQHRRAQMKADRAIARRKGL